MFTSGLPWWLSSKEIENESCSVVKAVKKVKVATVKNLPAMQDPQEMWVRSKCLEDPLEEGMATHSSILAWRIPQTGESSGL